MRFEEKLEKFSAVELWEEYCGFLDLDIDSYMGIQDRLLREQITLWSRCPLGQKFLHGKNPKTMEEFREMVPLTSYGDYAQELLSRQEEMLPGKPAVWIQTTWEGGIHPVKTAPYTKSMLETYRHNVMACLMLSTSEGRGKFDVSCKDHILYALAPLPFATGLLPSLVREEIGIEFLPSEKEALKLSFRERNKKGFKLGLSKGIQFFFGLGSVSYYVSQGIASLNEGETSGKTKWTVSPRPLLRMLRARYRCRVQDRPLKPRDLFHLKGLICAGTDNRCYKDDLEDLWGVRPMEIFAGTEPTCIGTETWTRDGMYFFPDACFYEFIPEEEMKKNFRDPSYQPKTILMNEVETGERYELVITVLKGGAFARYRVGDVYQCAGLSSGEDQTCIPRFYYIDRVPDIIDIAGFTRITENSIKEAVRLSGLPIENWIARKEYNAKGRPYLHMYVEMKKDSLVQIGMDSRILKEHLTVYFKYVDQDYADLKKILGMDPLEVTMLGCGAFEDYKRCTGEVLPQINPDLQEVQKLLKCRDGDIAGYRGGKGREQL